MSIETPADRIRALCEGLAAADGIFYLDCRNAAKAMECSHMTAYRWLRYNCEKISSVHYTKRKSNRWRLKCENG